MSSYNPLCVCRALALNFASLALAHQFPIQVFHPCVSFHSVRGKFHKFSRRLCRLSLILFQPSAEFIAGNLLPSALLWITSQLAAANQIPPDCIQQLTEVGCEILASALSLNPSHLRELDLSHNDAGDSSVQELCAELIRAGCKLEKLKLGNCCLTEVCCGDLDLLLRSASSELRELQLGDNDLKGSGVKSLGLRRYL